MQLRIKRGGWRYPMLGVDTRQYDVPAPHPPCHSRRTQTDTYGRTPACTTATDTVTVHIPRSRPIAFPRSQPASSPLVSKVRQNASRYTTAATDTVTVHIPRSRPFAFPRSQPANSPFKKRCTSRTSSVVTIVTPGKQPPRGALLSTPDGVVTGYSSSSSPVPIGSAQASPVKKGGNTLNSSGKKG
eukprot:1187979-Prorocentrum_minimum.AAC.1